MPLPSINPQLLKAIKILSCVLVAGAIVLLIVKTSGLISEHTLLARVFWISSVALAFHGLEAILAAGLAHRLNQNPLGSALYVFWTGAAGLTELFQKLEDQTSV